MPGDKDTSAAPPGAKRRSRLSIFFIRLVKEKPLGTVGAVIVLIFFFTGLFADFVAPYGMREVHMLDSLSPPTAKYILGTDELGRDLFSRIIFGARISMTAGLGGAFLATLLSAVIGIFSGFVGGKIDLIIQRLVDGWMCFPGLFLILSVMAVLGPGLAQVILVMGLLTGIGGSRIVRGTVIGIKENVYVEASRAIGCSSTRIMIRHILPNVMAPIIVLFATRMAHMIITEATISFLGYGIPPPQPSWGGMLGTTSRQYMLLAPWMVIWPGLALSIAVYGINMFGDAMRDILDPRLRGGLGRYGTARERKEARLKKRFKNQA